MWQLASVGLWAGSCDFLVFDVLIRCPRIPFALHLAVLAIQLVALLGDNNDADNRKKIFHVSMLQVQKCSVSIQPKQVFEAGPHRFDR
ncbi:hypothetical protein ACVSNF_06850, partial [Pseudomonas aeruginosa]